MCSEKVCSFASVADLKKTQLDNKGVLKSNLLCNCLHQIKNDYCLIHIKYIYNEKQSRLSITFHKSNYILENPVILGTNTVTFETNPFIFRKNTVLLRTK